MYRPCMTSRRRPRASFGAALLLTLGLLAQAPAAFADWHQGKISSISFGYDGTVTFVVSGWSRNNCTCYTPWPNYMCLSRTRPGFKEEYAWLLMARALDAVVNLHIEESSCTIVALGEW